MRRRIDENQTHTQRKVRDPSYKRAELVKRLLEKVARRDGDTGRKRKEALSGQSEPQATWTI